jgi:hypothetical protein
MRLSLEWKAAWFFHEMGVSHSFHHVTAVR